MLAPNRLPELLQRPLRGRMRRHVEVKHLAGADFHDDEDVKHTKADGDYVEEIRSDDRFCVIPHECRGNTASGTRLDIRSRLGGVLDDPFSGL